MKFTQTFLLTAATLNLAIGAPVANQKSREIVARDAVKRAAANDPNFAYTDTTRVRRSGPATPKKLRSVLKIIGRGSSDRVDKRYSYGDTPRPKFIEEDLDKRYSYGDTPRPKFIEEDLDKRYSYGDTPRPKFIEEDLEKRYSYGDTPRPKFSVENLNKRYEYGSPEPEDLKRPE